jgi:hypothetical protein
MNEVAILFSPQGRPDIDALMERFSGEPTERNIQKFLSEEYLGTNATSGLRVLINLVLGGLLAAYWLPAPAATPTPAASKK